MVVSSIQRVTVDGAEMALWDIGSGDPVVFIHGGSGDECLAVIQEPVLIEHFRVIHFQRPGYALSGPATGEVTIKDLAAQVRKVMDHLGIDRANVEGLSLGGAIALQYAHDYPETVNALALIEPGIPSVFGKYSSITDALGTVGERYQAGDRDGAAKAFLDELAGPDFETRISPSVPEGWRERFKSELDVVLQYEAPAMNQWSFDQAAAERITCPVLNVTGSRSQPYFREIHELLNEWFPHAENVVIPEVNHYMLDTNPRECAAVLAQFFSKYPIGRS